MSEPRSVSRPLGHVPATPTAVEVKVYGPHQVDSDPPLRQLWVSDAELIGRLVRVLNDLSPVAGDLVFGPREDGSHTLLTLAYNDRESLWVDVKTSGRRVVSLPESKTWQDCWWATPELYETLDALFPDAGR